MIHLQADFYTAEFHLFVIPSQRLASCCHGVYGSAAGEGQGEAFALTAYRMYTVYRCIQSDVGLQPVLHVETCIKVSVLLRMAGCIQPEVKRWAARPVWACSLESGSSFGLVSSSSPGYANDCKCVLATSYTKELESMDSKLSVKGRLMSDLCQVACRQ